MASTPDIFTPEHMPGYAIFSNGLTNDKGLDEDYRYFLSRTWTDRIAEEHELEGSVNFIMLNPSTATHEEWDPTVRRCAGYAYDWGYQELIVTNLFGYRATDPSELYETEHPVSNSGDFITQSLERSIGIDMNLQVILQTTTLTDRVVCAWGNHGEYLDRGANVLTELEGQDITPHALTMTKAGQPGHPLYLSSDLTPRPISCFDPNS